MNIYKYLTFLLLGTLLTGFYLTRQLVNEVRAIQSNYIWSTGYILEIGGINYLRIDGEFEDGEIISLRIDR